MATLKDIVTTRLEQLDIGAVEAATQAGIERTFIRDIVEGRKKSVRSDKVAELARALSLDPDALARNELRVAGPETRKSLVSSFDPDAMVEHDGYHDVAYSREGWQPAIAGALPELDGRLGAGQGTVGEMINLPVQNGVVSGHRIVAEWLMPQNYLRDEIKASPGHTIIMEVIGDSMTPTYQPGDRVLIDLQQNTFASDTVYAISDGFSEPQIKRLQRVPFSNPTQVRIISDNPALETFTADLEQLTIIGRICGHIARK
ncbi:S24 family peptidase [Rhizobium rhizophilum]|uniref:S24 family peptidase n=2 Tax=Rhizobium rhizophilum TaxID=1850373 RepID=A0ABY2QY48_9HYPH|nr:S24 family peptidase [Rhizobium rhizophilum]